MKNEYETYLSWDEFIINLMVASVRDTGKSIQGTQRAKKI